MAPKAAPKPAAPEFPIRSLKVEGNRIFSEDKILALAGVQIGQPASKDAFEAARDRLVASGYFETVGYRYAPSEDKSGFSASFQVQEIQQSYPVQFERLPESEAQLRAALRAADPLFTEKIPGTDIVLKRLSEVLQKHLGAKLQDRVIGKVTATGPDALFIVFQPATMPPSIAEVTFVKNEVFPLRALQNAISGASVGAIYVEEKFRQILDSGVRPMYEARGRIRLSFPKITVEPAKDVNGLRVTVEVSEGETFTLGEVAVATIGIPAAELLKAANLKTGDIANFDEINAGVDRMRGLFRRNGFLQAKAKVDRKIVDAEKKVHLTVSIEPGQRYTFTKLNLVGLDILTEPHIRKMWAVQPGQPFNPDYPEFFLAKLKEDQVLENLGKTKSEIKMDDTKLTAEVTLYFR